MAMLELESDKSTVFLQSLVVQWPSGRNLQSHWHRIQHGQYLGYLLRQFANRFRAPQCFDSRRQMIQDQHLQEAGFLPLVHPCSGFATATAGATHFFQD
jgi:hypothetical protein